MKIKFNNIHLFLAVISIIAVCFSFIYSIDTYYSDSNRFFMIGILFVYGFLFRPSILSRHPVIAYFGVFIYLFVCQRFVIASYYTAHNWEHHYYTPEMVQETLWLMSLYIFSFYLMLVMLNGQFNKIISSTMSAVSRINDLEHKFKVASIFLLTTGVLSFLVVLNESVNGHNNALSSSLLHRFFFRLIIPEFFLCLLCALYLLGIKNKREHRITFVFLLLFFVVMRVAQGSKSGIFDLGIIFLFYAMFFTNSNYIKLNVKTVVIGLSVVILSIFVFNIIGFIRFSIWYDAADAYKAAELAKDPIIRIWDSISEISRRLGIIDDAMKVIYWKDLGFNDISHIVNVESVTKLSIDSLVPSLIYPDILKSQYALALMIGNKPTIIDGVPVYAGYWWGIFGYHIYVFGAYAGLLVMCIFVAITVLFIRGVMAFSTNTFKVTFVFLFIPAFFFNYIGFFGYEHLLSLYFNIPVIWIINYVLFELVVALSRKTKGRSKVHIGRTRKLISAFSNQQRSQ